MKRKLFALTVALVALSLLLGCARPGGQGAPPKEKTVVVGLGELVKSFDPPYDWAIAATWIQSNIMEPMVWRDRVTGEFVPWLAERWEILDDRTWRFYLRKGIKFHNGEPFNAEAVKFSIDRILNDPKALVYNQWTFIQEVKVVDEYTVDVITKDPEPAMLSKISGTGSGVVPPKYYKEVGPDVFARKPVGTGPFKFVEEVKDDRIVLEANPEYWQGKPDIDKLIFRAIPEPTTRVSELLTGGIQLIENVPPQYFEQVKTNPNTKLETGLGVRTVMLICRIGDQEGNYNYTLNNKALRAAIEHAINKNKLVELIGGMGVPTRTRVTPPCLYWHEGLYGPKNGDIYDPQKAKELLEEAKKNGYKGEELEIVTSVGAWLMSKEVGEAIVSMLGEVGIKARLKALDVTTYREQIYFPSYQGKVVFQHMNLETLGNSFFDPWIAVLSYTAERGKRYGWDKLDLTSLVEAAARNMNPQERAAQYKKIQEIVAEERPTIFLYHAKESYGLSKNLEWPIPPDGFIWLGNAKYDTK